MSLQPVYDIAEICARQGITHAVISPGSRNAAITLAFTRHKDIKTFVIPDERSAGFIALGLALQLGAPVAIVCTSGTAAFNLAPAVAEAFFQQVPLLVLTADRPPEWIGQQDGQAIFQRNIFGPHVKQAYELPVSRIHPDEIWHINRLVNQAILLARALPRGPVHLNVPFREPFYPASATEKTTYTNQVRIIREVPSAGTMTKEEATALAYELRSFHRIVLVAGQMPRDESLLSAVQNLPEKLVVLADITANLNDLKTVFVQYDMALAHAPEAWKEDLQPDLLITFGNHILSKHLKLYLRKHRPAGHWHVQPQGDVPDVFQSLTRIIRCTPASFCQWLSTATVSEHQTRYAAKWRRLSNLTAAGIESFLNIPASSELHLTRALLQNLPAHSHLHLANSMSVRYAAMMIQPARHVVVHSNRGTSGIDGCTSTAVGHSLAHSALHVLLTGDLAFFYDRNAFWHNYPLPNLRIAVLNNHGGLIFKLIDGPAHLPEADEYFVTQQQLTAKHLCAEFGFEYIPVRKPADIPAGINKLLAPGPTAKILELESRVSDNVSIFESLKHHIRQTYATQISLAAH
ncbi:MAG: 2-succinyl-5-enolpyruvyl-6-hydroxy-3-cyclohexene-1-carboxylate synthase [Cyclobacteriaceae bacterium]|nr:MAG: 2-succinyl-5-enolpyruvyl-6-hydroxy-3-cyclohexene-1-carboxylate synthase [Cyclobacteriaceae bacterium]